MNDTTALPLPQKKGLTEEQTIRSPQGSSRQGVGHYWLGKTLGKGSSGTTFKFHSTKISFSCNIQDVSSLVSIK